MKTSVFAVLLSFSLIAPASLGQSSDRGELDDAFRRAAERDLRVQTLASEYEVADVVVLARVQSGQIVQLREELCGVEVSAQVVEAFKGRYVKGDSVRVARSLGMGIGSHYLMFLSEGDDEDSKELQALLGLALSPQCQEVLPQLVPVGPGIVRGNDSLGINAIPKYLYFEGSWTFPPEM